MSKEDENEYEEDSWDKIDPNQYMKELISDAEKNHNKILGIEEKAESNDSRDSVRSRSSTSSLDSFDTIESPLTTPRTKASQKIQHLLKE